VEERRGCLGLEEKGDGVELLVTVGGRRPSSSSSSASDRSLLLLPLDPQQGPEQKMSSLRSLLPHSPLAFQQQQQQPQPYRPQPLQRRLSLYTPQRISRAP
jgi:hypothetical protein